MNHNSILVKSSQQSVNIKLTHANVLPYSAVVNMNFNKGGKFYKKLWCCIGGEYITKIIWFYQLG